MNFQAIALYIFLLGYYTTFCLFFDAPHDVVYFTSIYILLLVILKIWQDKGVYLSLLHIMAVAYLYYIVKEIWFYNPMLSEFKEEEIIIALQLVSIGTVLMITPMACSSNNQIFKKNHAEPQFNELHLNKWITVSMFGFYAIFMAIPAYLTLTLGRSDVYDTAFASISLLVPFLNAMGYLLPVFLHMSFKGGVVSSLFKFAMIGTVFAIQIGIGNRFVILFSFFIYLSTLVDMRQLGVKNLVLPVALLSFFSFIMAQLRSASEVTAEAATSSESIVYYLTGLVRYYSEQMHGYMPIYSSFSLYFLLPRAVWSDKPELIGTWLLSTGVFITKFSVGHSGSVSFIGPFFADFGYFFVLPLFMLGCFMIYLDRYLLKYVGEHSKRGIIAASFIPLVFFGYRSFNTSMAAEVILIMFVILVAKLNQLKMTNNQGVR